MPTIPDADITACEFTALLTRHGVSVAGGSRVEAALKFPEHVLRVRNQHADMGEHDDTAVWREMLGIYDLAKRLLAAEQASPDKFQWLSPWLKRFASPRGQLAQTASTERGDKDSDVVFELLVAVCLLPFIEDLRPDTEHGGNPDLLFEYRSRRWGVACKRLHAGAGPKQYRRATRAALRQIEDSTADVGLVIISLALLIKHDLFYRMNPDMTYLAFPRGRMRELLEVEEDRLRVDVIGLADRQLSLDLAKEFQNRKAVRGTINYVGTNYLAVDPDSINYMDDSAVEVDVDTVALTTVQHLFSLGNSEALLELMHIFQDGLNTTSSDYRPGEYAARLQLARANR
jgi:hypothetical protein